MGRYLRDNKAHYLAEIGDPCNKVGRVYPQEIEDPELDAEYTTLSEQLQALEEVTFERELTEDEEETFETFERRMAELESARRSDFAPQDKAGAGVFVSINHDGSVRLDHGFIRKEDRKAHTAKQSGDGPGAGEGKDALPEGPKPYSNAQLGDLAIARNEVFQAHLAQAPEAAFDLLVFSLATSLLRSGHADTGLTVSTGQNTIPSGDGPSDAAMAFLAAKDVLDLTWLKGDDTGARFADFCALSFEAREAIMAWCVAAMAMPRLDIREPNHPIEQAGERIGIDTRSLWTPSTQTLFARLSKGQILAVLAECAGQAFADRHASMKKGDLVNITDRFFKGDAQHHCAETGAKADAWLPGGMAFRPVAPGDDTVADFDVPSDGVEAGPDGEPQTDDPDIEKEIGDIGAEPDRMPAEDDPADVTTDITAEACAA